VTSTGRPARIHIIAAEAGVLNRARAIWAEHPVLKELSILAVFHFEGVPSPGSRGLAHRALHAGVEAFERAVLVRPVPAYTSRVLDVLCEPWLAPIVCDGRRWDPGSMTWDRFRALAPQGVPIWCGERVEGEQARERRASALGALRVMLGLDGRSDDGSD
jgi:hypothetical protein